MLFLLLSFFSLCVSVAYLTLLERHLLGLSQLRWGPSKNTLFGVVQPFIDAFKLFSKSVASPYSSNPFYFILFPMLSFLLIFMIPVIYQSDYGAHSLDISLLVLMCLSGISVYVTFFTGLSSISKYGFLGAVRSTAASISYEVLFFFSILFILVHTHAYGGDPSGGFYMLPVVPILIILTLIEVGRAPFDITEGESELVSGYNLEYGGVQFIFLFLSEYGVILCISVVLSNILFGWEAIGASFSPFILSSIMIMCRSAFPRIRYDTIIALTWYVLIPLLLQLILITTLI